MNSDHSYDVFLSYNSSDHVIVAKIADMLEERGLRCFLDRWYLMPGDSWLRALEKALDNSRTIAVFLGPGGLGPWQQREQELALDRQSKNPAYRVIPVLLPQSDPALGFLSTNMWVDFRDGVDAGQLDWMAAAIRGDESESLRKIAATTVATVCPFRGLLPFREEDAAFFFGRESFTDDLVSAVERHSFVAVVGPSGSGKSSVVRAGLLPSLRKGTGNLVWEIVTLVPTERPFRSLAGVLAPLLWPEQQWYERAKSANTLSREVADGSFELRDAINRVLDLQPGTDRILIVVDQWEELYVLCRDPSNTRRFIDVLLELTKENPVTVVMTVRGDFFGQVLEYRPLVDRLRDALVQLGPMTGDELRSAIERPAAKVGLSLEAGLDHRILDDVGSEPAQLPLMEFVLKGLWDERRSGQLTNAAYDSMGGIKGAIATRAEQIFKNLRDPDQSLVRSMFIQLVRVGDESDDTRRRARVSTLGEDTKPLIRQLVDERLLVTGRDEASQDEIVEVAHEALIRHWKRLSVWVNEARSFLHWRRSLEPFLDAWRKDPSAVLRGGLLAEAERWLTERKEDLDDIERQFIEASIHLRQRDEQEKEQRQRQQHEQERKRHELEIRAKEKAKMAARLLRLTLLAGIVAVIAIILGVLAEWQRRDAVVARRRADIAREAAIITNEKLEETTERLRKQHEITHAQTLAFASETLRSQPENTHLSVLLAVESMRRTGSLEADETLRRALSLLPRPIAIIETPDVTSAVLNADGSLVAIASSQGTSIWAVRTQKPLTILGQDDEWVSSVQFSPNGKYLAKALYTTERVLSIWEWREGKWVFAFSISGQSKAEFGPKSKLLATGGEKIGQVWDLESRTKVGDFTHNDAEIRQIEFNPSGTLIAIRPGYRIVRHDNSTTHIPTTNVGIFRSENGTPVATLEHGTSVVDIAFSPKEDIVVTFGGKEAKVWDATNGELRWSRKINASGESVAFDPGGNQIATLGYDDVVRFWQSSDGRELSRLYVGPEASYILEYSHANQIFASVTKNDTARLWNVVERKEIARLPHKKRIVSVSFSQDGKTVATAGKDGRIQIWRTEAQEEYGRIKHAGSVTQFAVHPRRPMIVTASDDGTAILWDTAARKEIKRFHHNGAVTSVCFNSAVSMLATSSNDGFARIWDTDSWGPIHQFQHQKPVTRAEFHPNGRSLYTSDATNVLLWDIETGTRRLELPHRFTGVKFVLDSKGSLLATDDGRSPGSLGLINVYEFGKSTPAIMLYEAGPIRTMVFSPDSQFLAAGAWDNERITDSVGGILSIWNLQTGKRVTDLPFHGMSGVEAVAYSPDGKFLVSATRDYTCRVYDVAAKTEIKRLIHEAGVTAVAFTEDGKYLVTGSNDRSVRIWDTVTWRPTARMRHDGKITSVGLTHSGKFVVSTSEDGTARIWLWRRQDLIREACNRIGRNFTRSEWRQYVGDEPYRATCENLPTPSR
jgi:WD40 repeat protein/energy-coupling factor transporter ATP-binding protein EcfA2